MVPSKAEGDRPAACKRAMDSVAANPVPGRAGPRAGEGDIILDEGSARRGDTVPSARSARADATLRPVLPVAASAPAGDTSSADVDAEGTTSEMAGQSPSLSSTTVPAPTGLAPLLLFGFTTAVGARSSIEISSLGFA
jgi:hypothetical protein